MSEESEEEQTALNHAKPYIDQVKSDIDAGSINIGTDLASLEQIIIKYDVSLSYKTFQDIRKYAVKKYPTASVMPQTIIDGVDGLLLWQITAIPKVIYEKKMPERYVDFCLNTLPEYNNLFHGIEFDVTFHKPDEHLSMDKKRDQIKKFLQFVDKHYTNLLYSLNVNAQHSDERK